MVAFVQNGPDIPEALLHAHEEGRVVFFCGAGISMPAGLPNFAGLVTRIYAELHEEPESVEQECIDNQQYDMALGLLERRVAGDRETVRKTLPNILQPKRYPKGATATHEALLQLSTDRRGAVRLVTTNFDRLFVKASKKQKRAISSLAAPHLPVPKASRWDGVVYLHGLLPPKYEESALNHLVLSSGDFGLAYLTERWAARFVTALLRDYIVCFVGYDINDPVLRYMMDALAADELLGESPCVVYAFASFGGESKKAEGKSKKTEMEAITEWKAKGVKPLLYNEAVSAQSHAVLHSTLKEWAATYRDGIQGRKMVITQHAGTPPLSASRSDFAVGRVLWALTNEAAAKHFSNMNPVPPFEWIKPLSENQFGYDDLPRFGIAVDSSKKTKEDFSILCRPTPHFLAPLMSIADAGTHTGGWDTVMCHLANWLARHLDNPELILWVAKNGGQLNENFARVIYERIAEIVQLENEGKKKELADIRAAAPQAIPTQHMRTLWQIVLAGRLRPNASRYDIFSWTDLLKQTGLTPYLRAQLRVMLSPCITVHPPLPRDAQFDDVRQPDSIMDLVSWQLVLSDNDAYHAFPEIISRSDKSELQEYFPQLLPDFVSLLRDALNLMQELGSANTNADMSCFDLSSIAPHPQNISFNSWAILIELTRDAWLAMAQQNRKKARAVAMGWWKEKYPAFKRLALFAATQGENIISQQCALRWLLANRGKWLWSEHTKRETFRLVNYLGPKLDEGQMASLVAAILDGHPRAKSKSRFHTAEQMTGNYDRMVWLRLAKMKSFDLAIGRKAMDKLRMLEQQYPEWKLADDERDEFSIWIETGTGSDFREFARAPRDLAELVEWLKKFKEQDVWVHDDWINLCQQDTKLAFNALNQLAEEGLWPPFRWGQAFHAWSEENLIQTSWGAMSPVLLKAPDAAIQALGHEIGLWMQSVARAIEGADERFFSLCRRFLAVDHAELEIGTKEILNRAINHPIGRITHALIEWWFRQSLKDGQGLSSEVKPIFTDLCDTGKVQLRSGRALLAARTIALYRVDYDWTKKHLLPLFDWQKSAKEANVAWGGFLWSPRIYPPLLSDIKAAVLETAEHHDELGVRAGQYADFLTFIALNPGDIFTYAELAKATGKLSHESLARVAFTLYSTIKSADKQRSEYWNNRVRPYLERVWPKTLDDRRTQDVSAKLAKLCVETESNFPDAFDLVQGWLQPLVHTYIVLHYMREKNIPTDFPEESLSFLHTIIDGGTLMGGYKLRDCLDDIAAKDEKLARDWRFLELEQWCS